MNDADLAEHLRELEEELLRPETRHDSQRLGVLLADDFREFGSSGRVLDKAITISELTTHPVAGLSLTDFACQRLAPNIALVTYRSHRGDDIGMQSFLRSSLWVYRDRRWQILFHQDTRI